MIKGIPSESFQDSPEASPSESCIAFATFGKKQV